MPSTPTTIDTDCKLLLHCDGSDASTTFVDSEINTAKTVTANGDAQVDTAQSVFGGASCLLDGTGDYLSVADSSDFDVAAGDFTIDFRMRFNGATATAQLAGQYNQTGSQIGYLIQWLATNNLRFVFSTDGTLVTVVVKSFAWTPSADTWYHIAIVRSGNNLYAFVDGVQIGATADVTGVTIFNSTALFEIGKIEDSSLNMFNGWIDEFRFVKGTAVWVANFTPPAAAYSSILNTQIGRSAMRGVMRGALIR